MRVSEAALKGRPVIAADGRVLGEVETFFVESDDWSVASLVVTLRKEAADELGAHRTMFHSGTLEIPTRLVQSLGETIVLAVPSDELRRVLPSESEQPVAP